MLLAERAGRKLEPWSNSRPRGMAVITRGLTRVVVTESGLSAYFISSFMLRHGDHANRSASRFYLFNVVLIAAWMRAGHRIFIFFQSCEIHFSKFESDFQMRAYIFVQLRKTDFHTTF